MARELLIEGLAVEHAGEHFQLVRRERARLRDLQTGGDLVMHPHRQPEHMAPPAGRCEGAVPLAGYAIAKCGGFFQRFAARVWGGYGIGRDELSVLNPGTGAYMGHAVNGEKLQRAHFNDATERLQRGQHRHLQPQVVAVASHFHQVLENGLHWDVRWSTRHSLSM